MKLRLIAGLAMAAVLSAPAAIAEGNSGFTIVPGIGYYDIDNDRGVDSDMFGSLGLGYQFSDRFTLELVGSRLSSELDGSFLGAMNSDVDLDQYRLDALYTLNPEESLQGYLVFGGGHSVYDVDLLLDEVEESFANYGFGLKKIIDDRTHIRGDLRGVTSLDEETTDIAFNLAVSYMFAQTGSKKILDSDGDGVVDKLDQCPGTPAGVQVDEKGCALDSDGDGVPNHKDKCPNTPQGVKVDANGCAADSDGDGVPDHADECPDSRAGAKVDEKGCYIVITEDVTVELDVEFDTNSAASRPEHAQEVAEVVQFMREHPLTQVLVEGHTDDRGSAAYNQNLSERRAKTIADAIVNSGIAASRVRSVGVGEARPRADNSTEEGRQRNRRVVAVVSAQVEKEQ